MTYREILLLLAKLAMAVAIAITMIGGWDDMKKNDYRMTKNHLWNDGLFLAVLAVFLLVLART